MITTLQRAVFALAIDDLTEAGNESTAALLKIALGEIDAAIPSVTLTSAPVDILLGSQEECAVDRMMKGLKPQYERVSAVEPTLLTIAPEAKGSDNFETVHVNLTAQVRKRGGNNNTPESVKQQVFTLARAGNSSRAISKLTGISKVTVMRLCGIEGIALAGGVGGHYAHKSRAKDNAESVGDLPPKSLEQSAGKTEHKITGSPKEPESYDRLDTIGPECPVTDPCVKLHGAIRSIKSNDYSTAKGLLGMSDAELASFMSRHKNRFIELSLCRSQGDINDFIAKYTGMWSLSPIPRVAAVPPSITPLVQPKGYKKVPLD